MTSRSGFWSSSGILLVCSCIPATDMKDGLGPCSIDASGWSVAGYNFTTDNIYFACQPDKEEAFYVTPYFDGMLLSNEAAEEAAQLAVGSWDAVWSGPAPWSFTSNLDPAQVFDSADGLSSLIATAGFSVIPDRLASKSVTVYNDENVDCDVRFFTEMSDIAGDVEAISWSHGTGTGYELATIMAHEIGHCLGLGHPNPGTHVDSIMREELGVGDAIVLSSTDRAAIEFLYGPDSTTTPAR